ncbi:hypothetical protein CYY_007372 [Polysphondylium violaceum]|uniref:Carbohydrate binding domain-containing protein n=1 Tax=Polysphondylium violaceum TaxID=133409 RepID=A0A8J4UXR2_9MYCE|nr:hypothetical protein CYY_007372 [Polysphondylium violaceum]
MKLFILISILIGVIAAQNVIPCSQFLAAYNDPSKCVTLSVAGVHSLSLAQEGYKGYLYSSNNVLRNNGKITNLQTYETYCNNGKRQPFSAPDAFYYDDVKIFTNGSFILKGVQNELTCYSDGFATYRRDYFFYSLALRAAATCEPLYYGEACQGAPVVTVPPVTSPSASVSFTVTVDNQWTTLGVVFYQYGVTIKNNESNDLKDVKVSSSNWAPTEIWGLVKSGDFYILPSYISSFPAGATHSFGFVSATKNPTFSFTK